MIKPIYFPTYSTNHSITPSSLEFVGDSNPSKATTFFIISPLSEAFTLDPFNKVLASVASTYGKPDDIVIVYDTANKIENMKKSTNPNQAFFRNHDNFSFYGFNDADSRVQERTLEVKQMDIFLTIIDELKNLASLIGLSLENIQNFQQEMTDNIKSTTHIFTRQEFASLLRDSDLEIFSHQGWIDLFYPIYLSTKTNNFSELDISKDRVNLVSLGAPILSKLGVGGMQSLVRIQSLITNDFHDITESMIAHLQNKKATFQERVNQLKAEFPEKKIFTILPASFIFKTEVKLVVNEKGTTDFHSQVDIDPTYLEKGHVLVSLQPSSQVALTASYVLSKFHTLGIIPGNPYSRPFSSKL